MALGPHFALEAAAPRDMAPRDFYRGPRSARWIIAAGLDTDVDEDAEAAWATEVNRRMVELRYRSRQDCSLDKNPPPNSPRDDPSVRGRSSALAADAAGSSNAINVTD